VNKSEEAHMIPAAGSIVDVHCHVGLLGDRWPQLGRLGPRFVSSPAYPIFLAYARVASNEASDTVLRERTEAMLASTKVDHVVALALDMVHDGRGNPDSANTSMFVANEYVLDLQRSVGAKVLFGASVHPYRADFEARVRALADKGAVLLKWIPSAQGIDLAAEPAARALRALARLGPSGGPLPLLLHTGVEYAVPPASPDARSRDFLTWSVWDRFWNLFRKHRWSTPDVARVQANLRAAVEEGAVVILAHSGLPYFAPRGFGAWAEHADFATVRALLGETAGRPVEKGKFLTDVSACCTPFRHGYFPKIAELPADAVLYGSDFPTPVFELSLSLERARQEFAAIRRADLAGLIVPEGNLLDVNLRELAHHFPGHPMFTNFSGICQALHLGAPTGA
jgi:hypothetical protein